MQLEPSFLFPLFWGLWLASWVIAARWASAPVAVSSARVGFGYGVPTLLGAVILFAVAPRVHGTALWHVGRAGSDILAFLTVPCFLFAWWARLHLGILWSSQITRKADHHVVDTGPYGIVRHPIYTGLIGATLLTAIAIGNLPALVGAALMVLGFWLKARFEEGFLADGLGAEAYEAYRRNVPMLVPFARLPG
jgi:protein-S-isoprenylcysteine O-methyltransferase Ste14